MTSTSGISSSYQPKFIFYELRPDQDSRYAANKFGAENIDPTADSAQPGDMVVFNTETLTLSA